MSAARATSIRNRFVRVVIGGVLVFAGSSGIGVLSSALRLPLEFGLSVAHAQIRSIGNVCNWDSVDWDQMSNAEQRAWETLGWIRELWQSNNSNAVPTSSEDWSHLSLDEKSAAEALGYNAESWEQTCPPSQ